MRSTLRLVALLAPLAACTGSVSTPPLRPPGPSPDEVRPPPAAEFDCDEGVVDPGPNLVRRLTLDEYSASVQAALGVDIREPARATLPPDLRSDGFSNTSAGQVVLLEHVEAYEALARLAVEAITDLSAFVGAHTSCTDFTPSCEQELLRSLAVPIYRAPLAAEEEAALLRLFDVVEAEGDAFVVAAGLVLEAMLQSPRFLYRVERERGEAGLRPLDGWELASRLSYLVWGAPPDEALSALAAEDGLTDDAAVEAQVRRMLDDPRARAASIRYFTDWLALLRLDTLTRDPELFPEWDATLGAAMREETQRFFEHLVWEERRPLRDLFDAQFTFASPALAAHYGLEAGPDGRVDLSAHPERGGLLTQGSIATIGGSHSSMVSRGKFLLETFLCGSISAPPAGIDTTPPEVEPGLSQRHYSEARVDSPVCGGCHVQMEPLAWGIERFDATGAYRLEDRFGNALAEDGRIVEPGAEAPLEFASVAEMMGLLAGSDRVRDCMSLGASQFAFGRPILASDGCSLAAMRDRFAASDGSYEELVVSIALSPGFRSIRTEVVP